MAEIRQKESLKNFNTFGIEVYCDYFSEINSISELEELQSTEVYKHNNRLILGGGSNILFTRDFKGLVIKNNIKGINVYSEDSEVVLVKAMAGEVWHEFVMWCLNRNYAGLENLSLIPGCVGASPMQNIGAYGVEIKEVFEELEAIDLQTGELRVFDKKDCAFGYRESVFKHQYKNQYIIVSVSFRLRKKAAINTTYGAINAELERMNIASPGIREVSEAVIRIRQSKLPDPKVTGNAGSFFKNPEVSADKHNALKKQFPDLVAYPLEGGNYKLAAGWLIEQCGLKGYKLNGAAVHLKQALVLINTGTATGEDVMKLSSYVIDQVLNKFDVTLEREVNIL